MYRFFVCIFTALLFCACIADAPADNGPDYQQNVNEYFLEELDKTRESVLELITEPCLVFPMITDIHYKSSAECPDLIDYTIENILALSKDIRFDFFVCLGDMVDGRVALDVTEQHAKYLYDQFARVEAPFYPCIGNHDDNRYYEGGDIFSHQQLYNIFMKNVSGVVSDKTSMCGTNYYKDFSAMNIRCIFLNANTDGKYGFSDETCAWFEDAVKTNFDIYVFSHISPVKDHQYNQGAQQNGDRIIAAIKGAPGFKMLFSGHSHFDSEFTAPFNDTTNPFLAYTQACNKFENRSRKDTWPAQASSPYRKLGTASEDCFDIVVIRPNSKKVNLVRFGAGLDREFDLLTGMSVGESSTALSPENLFESGSGTEADPYLIKSEEQWNNMVSVINGGLADYAGAYYKLTSDIDFKNMYVETAYSFRGVLDGGNKVLSNAKIGDGTQSHQAFFPYLSGTIKNIRFDNITVKASAPLASGDASTSAGVIVAGNNDKAFILENCHVTNSSVTSGKDDDTYGGYAGGLAGRAKTGAVIKNCSVKNTTVTCLTQNAGGLVGNMTGVTIESSLSSGNTVKSKNNSGGISGGAGPGSLIINCISEDNVCSVKTVSAGGVVGANAWNSNSTGEYPQIVNVLSQRNTMKSTRTDGSTLYIALIVGCRGTNDNNMSLKNCLVTSGTALYDYTTTTGKYPHAACVGIVVGYGSPAVESVYFNGAYRSLYDAYLYDVTDGKLRNAVGLKQSDVTSNSRGGTTLSGITECEEAYLSDGTCLDALNSWVSSNKETYPTLKEWTSDATNRDFPTLVL